MTLRDRYIVEQEPEGVRPARVALVASVAIVVACGAVAAAYWLLPGDVPLGQPEAGLEPSREEIGEVYVTRIRRRAIGQEKRREDREHLRAWGWVDRQRGIAHIPVEEAMRIIAERERREPRP